MWVVQLKTVGCAGFASDEAAKKHQMLMKLAVCDSLCTMRKVCHTLLIERILLKTFSITITFMRGTSTLHVLQSLYCYVVQGHYQCWIVTNLKWHIADKSYILLGTGEWICWPLRSDGKTCRMPLLEKEGQYLLGGFCFSRFCYLSHELVQSEHRLSHMVKAPCQLETELNCPTYNVSFVVGRWLVWQWT
jgi:hypothetical protein